ncbi:MAG TPA: winged helix-turn-helix transcriptional regulator [Solirubrobacterales bacterium]|nr:winged helix-turn-helix transcriptional regulator [Solirubrobacterales bacterium]
MTGTTVNGSGTGARSGAQTLLLLAAPLNMAILRALAERPLPQADLQSEVGAPAQSTLRTQLKRLAEIGALEKRRRDRFPGALEYELTASGEELLCVADVLAHWLEHAPQGPLESGSGGARATVKAFAEGWSSTMLRALAAGPLSLTELDAVIGAFSYPALDRRLAALRLCGLVEANAAKARGTPYAVTEWLRRAVAPLLGAARWECRHLAPPTTPAGRVDIEATLLLAAPLLHGPPDLSGSVRLAAEIPGGNDSCLAGATIELTVGRVAACSTRLRIDVDGWATGSLDAWLSAVIEDERGGLELGGKPHLADTVLRSLHDTLFATVVQEGVDAWLSIREYRSN